MKCVMVIGKPMLDGIFNERLEDQGRNTGITNIGFDIDREMELSR